MDQTMEDVLADLLRLLHQGAPADEFSKRLVRVESLPDATRRNVVAEFVRMAMAVSNRLELQQQRERGMLALSESAQDLSSRLDLDELLRTIVFKARNLLGSHVAWLSIYDAEQSAFKALVADGALSQNTSQMSAGPDLGVAGVVMATCMPFSTANYLQDSRFKHDAALDDTFREEGIAALVGVPLVWDQQVIGLLFVADRYHRTHDALSISILSTLATHAAVAIRNAKAFEQASVALQNAESAKEELEGHTRNIQAAAEAHEELTSLLAKGASLSVLCESVAQSLDGAVIVIDEASQIISQGVSPAYRGTAANAYLPHGPRSNDIATALRDSRRAGRSIAAFDEGDETCRVVAVIGGNDVLGAILLFRHREINGVSVRTFERSASVIGVVLLSQERMAAAKTRDATALLRALVSFRQDDPAVMRDRAERLGVDLSQPTSLMLIEVDDLDAGYIARRFRAGAPMPNVLLDEIDGMTAVLCATTRARDVVKTMSALAGSDAHCVYRGVISRPVTVVEELPALYATLRRALSVLKRIGLQGSIVSQNEMALYSVLFETQDRVSLNAFLDSTIGELMAYDQKRGSDLTPTLLCYFDNNQNGKETAVQLGLHVNTVRQRLTTIEELIGHWGQSTRSLEIHMALRLWKLGAGSAGPRTVPQ